MFFLTFFDQFFLVFFHGKKPKGFFPWKKPKKTDQKKLQKKLMIFVRKYNPLKRPFFAAFVNKSLTFKCSINDVGNTIFF